MRLSKLAVIALTASAVLAFAVDASAKRLQVSNQQFRIIWPSLEFIASGQSPILCHVTLEGSFHSQTLSKVSGQLVGYISKAQVVEACTNGTGRALTETLPWHVQYNSFEGVLPNIESVTVALIGARFQVKNSSGTACLAGTTQANPGFGIGTVEAGGNITTLRADETHTIPLGGEFLCSFVSPGRFAGTGEVFVLGSTTTRIGLTLVQ